MNQKIYNNIKLNCSLKNISTIKIGGMAKFFTNIKSEKELMEIIKWAKKNKVKWFVVGEGSNLIPNDNGFEGLVVKNEINEFKTKDNKVFLGAGNNLLKSIFKLNRLGIAGMEKMAGIPGTVGGAIRGSAGAYGQEIKDNIVRVKVYDGNKIFWLSKKQCHFAYRESIFKKNKNWVILVAEFKFKKRKSKKLSKISNAIIKLRQQKYWPDLLCPGSFFKNIVIKNIKPLSLKKKLLSRIPENKVTHGKVSAGYLLETIGSKGMGYGNIKVAKHHGNLIYNTGKGKSSEITKLAEILKNRVRKKFGISLEEEIQYL